VEPEPEEPEGTGALLTAVLGPDDGEFPPLPPAPEEGAVEGVPLVDGVPEGEAEEVQGIVMLGREIPNCLKISWSNCQKKRKNCCRKPILPEKCFLPPRANALTVPELLEDTDALEVEQGVVLGEGLVVLFDGVPEIV